MPYSPERKWHEKEAKRFLDEHKDALHQEKMRLKRSADLEASRQLADMQHMMEQAEQWRRQVEKQQEMEHADKADQMRYAEYDPAKNATRYWEINEWGERFEVAGPGQVVRVEDLGEIRTSAGLVAGVVNAIKPTIHKAGHFPIQWMIEAHERASASEKIITIQLEKEGVVVIGQEADHYETHTLPWAAMEHAEVNPVILGIETVEKHLDTLGRLKQRVRA